MNVMYATDDNYAEIAGISIESLLDNNQGVEEIRIFVVVDNVSEENKEKLCLTAEKYGRTIIFIQKPDIRGLTGTDLLTLRWSDSAFSRLYVDLIFREHKDVKKILYLDCDTLVIDSLEQLWNTDIDAYVGAAVFECMGNWHKKIVGANSKDHFFNSGVMLLNVERWEKDNVAARCTEFIKERHGRIEYVDQGVINGVLSRQIKVVDTPRYNLTALSWDFSYEEMLVFRKPDHGYSKEEWNHAINNPAIIHFTTSFLSTRPWFDGNDTPLTEKWREYKAQSQWKDAPLRSMKNRKKHDDIIAIFNRVPRGVGVGVAGFLHAYVKPLVFMAKYNVFR